MSWMPNITSNQDLMTVKLVDNLLGWRSKSRDKQLDTLLDRDVYYSVGSAGGVIIVGLSCASANLREQDVNPEWEVTVFVLG